MVDEPKPLLEYLKNALLILVSTSVAIVVCAIGGEVIMDVQYERWRSDFSANIAHWYGGLTMISENPNLMWEYRPNAVSNDPNMVEIRTNQHGFRDSKSKTIDKPDGTFRIVFIGDSVTLGYDVERQQSFVHKFEEYANTNGSDVKIQSMNFGIDGYNTFQVHELLASKVLAFNPDKVIYTMCLNDFSFGGGSHDSKSRYFRKPENFVLDMLQKVHRRLRRADFHQWRFNQNKQRVFDKITEMKHLLIEQDIEFQILVLPIFRFEGSEENFKNYPLNNMHREINKFLLQEHITFVDLLEHFENQSKSPAFFSNDIWHPNEEGHEVIAKVLVNR